MLLGVVGEHELHAGLSTSGRVETPALVSPGLGDNIWQVEVLEETELKHILASREFVPSPGVGVRDGELRVSDAASLGLTGLLEALAPGASLVVEPVSAVVRGAISGDDSLRELREQVATVDSVVMGADGSVPEFAESDIGVIDVAQPTIGATYTGLLAGMSATHLFQFVDDSLVSHRMEDFPSPPTLGSEPMTVSYDQRGATLNPVMARERDIEELSR